jgi:ATP-dependent DNA helicase RecG
LYGVPVEVLVFDDRLEVQSPGRLPGAIRVHNIRDSHFARNPRVARVLTDLGFVSDIGEGVDRMYDEMASAHLPPPEFEDANAEVRVTLRTAPAEASTDLDPVAGPSQRIVHLPAVIARTLNPRQRAALQFLRTNARLLTRDVLEMFPEIRDARTINVDLNELVKLGLLHRVGRTQSTYFHADGKTFLFPDEI